MSAFPRDQHPRNAPRRRRRPPPPASTRTQPVVRSLKDYLIMLRERWYYGLLAAVLVAGSMAAYQMTRPPVYASGTTIHFENPTQILDIRPISPGAGGEYINLATHIEQLNSGSFRAYVAASLTPEEVEVIRAAYLDPELSPSEQISVETILYGAVEVVERRDTPILEIRAYHQAPDAAELIANRYASRYIQFNNDRSATGTNSALLFLEDEEQKLRQQFEEAQIRLQDYREEQNTVSLTENQNVVAARLESISNERNEAKNERLALESTLRQVETFKSEGRNLVEIAYIAGFRSVGDTQDRLNELRAERAILDQRYLERHPRVLANIQATETLEAQLANNIKLAVAELENAYTRALQHEERLVTAQREAEQEALALQETAIGYNMLEKEVQGTGELLDEVLRRRKETAIQTQLDNVNIRIMDRAYLPSTPASPDVKKTAIQAIVVGAIFLFGVPIGLGMIDVRLKAAWEVEQFLEQNLLGEIPSITGVDRKDRAHIMARDLDHSASEAFRGLFGQMQLNSTVAYPKAVMLTSTLPGEGKSVVANNLASTFASHGKKTLLVDCDFRRPNLHLFYGKDNGCGVLRWMNAGGQLNGSLEDDPDLGILPVKQNLYLLRAGGEHRRATELFETDSYQRLLKAIHDEFEIALIDTPPMGVFPDAMLISRICDEVIYVCRFNAVNRSKIRKTLDRIQQSEGVLSGIVLNGLPTGKQSAYYDYYGYGSNESKRYKAYYAQKR